MAKYLVSSGNVKSYEEIFKVVDFLLSKDGVDLKPKAMEVVDEAKADAKEVVEEAKEAMKAEAESGS